MAKKKLSPPTWDEQNQRWKKVAYCNNMSKTFYSKRRGATSAEFEAKPCQKQCQKQSPGIPAEASISYSASSSNFVNLVYSITACSYVSQSFSSLAFTTHVLTLCSFFIISSFFMFFPLSDFRLPAPVWGGCVYLFCQISNLYTIVIRLLASLIAPIASSSSAILTRRSFAAFASYLISSILSIFLIFFFLSAFRLPALCWGELLFYSITARTFASLIITSSSSHPYSQ